MNIAQDAFSAWKAMHDLLKYVHALRTTSYSSWITRKANVIMSHVFQHKLHDTFSIYDVYLKHTKCVMLYIKTFKCSSEEGMMCRCTLATKWPFLSLIVVYIVISFPTQLRLSIASSEVRRKSFKRDQRAVRLILGMNVAYLVCWFPYAIICVIHIFISQRYVN